MRIAAKYLQLYHGTPQAQQTARRATCRSTVGLQQPPLATRQQLVGESLHRARRTAPVECTGLSGLWTVIPWSMVPSKLHCYSMFSAELQRPASSVVRAVRSDSVQ